MKLPLIACALAVLVAAPAMAAPADQLRCLDDKLNDQQRAGISALFARQPDDPKDAVAPAQGSASAAYDLTYALASCTGQFGWNQARQDAATNYLILAGRLSRIKISHTPAWNSALERTAPFAVQHLHAVDGPDDQARAMMLAAAKANGAGAAMAGDGDDVVAFVQAWKKVDAAIKVFNALP